MKIEDLKIKNCDCDFSDCACNENKKCTYDWIYGKPCFYKGGFIGPVPSEEDIEMMESECDE